jgi:hypothetical protein
MEVIHTAGLDGACADCAAPLGFRYRAGERVVTLLGYDALASWRTTRQANCHRPVSVRLAERKRRRAKAS